MELFTGVCEFLSSLGNDSEWSNWKFNCVCVFEGELKKIFDVRKQLSYLWRLRPLLYTVGRWGEGRGDGALCIPHLLGLWDLTDELILLQTLMQFGSSAISFHSSSSKVGQCYQARSRLQKYTYLSRFVPSHWFWYLSISLSFLFFPKSCLRLNISLHHLRCFSPKQVLSILLWENRSSLSIAGNKMCNPFSTQQPRWSFKIKISSRQSPLCKTFMVFYWC